MRLSDLVQLRNNLRDISQEDAAASVRSILAPILHMVETNQELLDESSMSLKDDLDQVLEKIRSFDQDLDKIFHSIDQSINDVQPTYFAESYLLYDKYMRKDSTELILNRRFSLTPSAQSYITARIQRHSNWKYPGMVIRPGLEGWEELLVGLDPLYLVDQTHDLLEPIRTKFTQDYQRRLRYYAINEDDEEILKHLPKGQMAFCLAYNFFGSKPLEVVRKYLSEIFAILRPGGTFGFTFVDGDRPGGARLVERNFVCYTPESMIRNLAESLGYEIGPLYHIDAANSWLEIQKPGELTGLRGGQSLAKIIEKTQ